MLRFLTAGESHGVGLVTIVDGLPAGLRFTADGLAGELARRRQGYGRGPRMRIERDEIEIIAGIRFGLTTGAPVAVVIRNTEAERWKDELDPAPGGRPKRLLTTPRPGHADLPGMQKYDTGDARPILERASARETAARAVAGYAAEELLAALGVSVVGSVVQIGGETASRAATVAERELIEASPTRSVDGAEAMMMAIDRAKADRDTLGGIFAVVAEGVPAGLGSHTQWDRRLDGLLGRALLSIPAVKGVEIGDAFATAAGPGSAAHDEIDTDRRRLSNRAGGVEGGMSNGEPIVVKAAMKPLSTLMRPLRTVDVATGGADVAFRERSDVCAVPAASVVGEHMVAWTLAVAFVEMFGGDTITDVQERVAAYRARLDER